MSGESWDGPAARSRWSLGARQLCSGLAAVAIAGVAMSAALGFLHGAQARSSPAVWRGGPAQVTAADSAPGNLLVNPDFEDGHSYPISGHNNIAVPNGWNIVWYEDYAPGHDGDTVFKYKQPEVKIIDSTVWPFCCQLLLPPRIHTGRYAVESFALFANQDTSVYQTVGGIPIGAVVTATAWLHAWVSSCDVTPSLMPVVSLQGPTQQGCPDGYWPIDSSHMMAGLDPYGGTDPRAPTVVWNWNPASPPWWGPYDYYSPTLPVVTVARAHSVTFFLRGVTNQPAKHDNIFFDTTSLTFSFPISVGVEQDRPWPLPVSITVAVQSPVSFTQAVAAMSDPNGAGVPGGFVGTTGISPTVISRWRFNPAVAGRHAFSLTAYELASPLAQPVDVRRLWVHAQQDRLLPPGGAMVTEPALITLTLSSPLSLTTVAAVVTDPLGASTPITLVGVTFADPDFVFQWRFGAERSGLHLLRISADQFTQLLVQPVMAATGQVYLPIALKNAAAP